MSRMYGRYIDGRWDRTAVALATRPVSTMTTMSVVNGSSRVTDRKPSAPQSAAEDIDRTSATA